MLVALWLASRRSVDARVARALENVDERLVGLTERIEAASSRTGAQTSGLDAIGSTIDLDEVLHRTLAAAAALPTVDGGAIRVQRGNGAFAAAVQGHVRQDAGSFLSGPPDGAPFVSGVTSWQVEAPDALRTALVVPVGPGAGGTLTVFSRNANAFDVDAAELLATIARHAFPAIQNAFRYLEVQELAATDVRTGLRSTLAFDEELPREISAARRHGRPLCLIQVDLDDFGRINKEHSQETGNAVLEAFGERVLATIRGGDGAYRNSGGADEFFLILPDTTRDLARHFYGRLNFEITGRPFGEAGTMTMSSGLVELRPEDTPATLKERSGALVKQAKEQGKNQLCDDTSP